jgi:uncharacterized repeat protein (TIGR03803 family)
MTYSLRMWRAALIIGLAAVPGPGLYAQSKPTYSTVFQFTYNNGAYPFGGLVYGKNGSLFGATFGGGKYGYGAIYEMTPPTSGQSWTPAVIFAFQTPATQGSNPYGGLLVGPNGALYGTTTRGGANGVGTVYELVPPAKPGAGWSETLLYSFGSTEGDGSFPYGGVVMDTNGNFYGTTVLGGASGVGTVYSLTPSGHGWEETVLHSFGGAGDAANPYATLAIDAIGILYGTTPYGGEAGLGAVFSVAPSQDTWTEQVLCSFPGGAVGANPYGGLLIAGGALYGSNANGGSTSAGTVFTCAPAGSGGWALNVIFDLPSYASSYGTLIADANGSLYGTTPGSHGAQANDGIIFKLTPPTESGGEWTATTLFAFPGAQGDGPRAGVIWGPGGALYGTTVGLGKSFAGNVFELAF